MQKIIMTNNIIAPTNTLLFNSLREFFHKKWIEFIMIFNAETESNRKWNTSKEKAKFKFKYYVLEGKKLHNTGWADNHYFHVNYWFTSILNQENPDLIVHCGWAAFTIFNAIFRCKMNKKQLYLWSGSTKYEKSRRRIITKPLVKRIVRQCSWYWSYGTRATEYLVSLWANKHKIFPLYNTVDVEYFKKESDIYRKDKEKIKKELWISTKHVLMFNGQLIERKWIREMVDWFNLFQKENKDISLLMVWSGQEEQKFKEYIKKNDIKNIFFTGYVQIDELPKYYAISDIFTLPSREEVWWLVINEAMACGLPILTAYQLWASVDLVKEGENWYIMKENTASEFEKWLEYILKKDLIKNNTSLHIISKFTLENVLQHIQL